MNTELSRVDILPPTLVESQTRAEIDMQISTAHRFPRDLQKSKDTALTLATSSPKIAQKMFYTLPRYDSNSGQNKHEIGPSIRMAELIASTWGNIRIQSYIVEVNDTEVVAEGVAHDLESNAAVKVQSRSSILTKQGKRFNEKMITTTSAAACSKSLRNAILKVVPEPFWAQIFERAIEVAAKGGLSLADRRETMIAKFSELGVSKAQILEFAGVGAVELIDLEAISKLVGAYQSIQEGTVIDDFFRPEGAATEAEVAEFWKRAMSEGWMDRITKLEEKAIEPNSISAKYLNELRITCLKRMQGKDTDAEESENLEKANDKKKAKSAKEDNPAPTSAENAEDEESKPW